jgi:hypothetical protein
MAPEVLTGILDPKVKVLFLVQAARDSGMRMKYT